MSSLSRNWRSTSFTLAGNSPAQMLAVNSTTAAAIVPLRRDLDIVPARDPLSVLRQPSPVGVTLPGRPDRMQLVVSLSAPATAGTGIIQECASAACDSTVGVREPLAGMSNATLTVMLTDGAFSKAYTATVNGAGTGWTAAIPTGDATTLADGTATATTRVTDQYGNVSLVAVQTVAVHQTLPTVTIAPPLATASATATLVGNTVTAITLDGPPTSILVTNGGSGYSNAIREFVRR